MAVIVIPVLCVTSTGCEDSWSCSVSESPDSSLCFTLLASSRSYWACVQWQRVQCIRASQQQWTTQHREERVACCLRRPCPPLHSTWSSVSGYRCHTSPPPPPPPPKLIARLSHLGIARNVPRKPRRSRRGGKNEPRKIKVIVGFRDRLPSDSSSSPTPCRQPAELDFYHFSSALVPHTTAVGTTCLSTHWPWRPHSLLAQRSAASPSETAASHSPWFFFSRKNTPSLSLQYKIRRHFQEEVRHIHLHSGQRFRHHAADGDLATPCRWRGQDRRSGFAWWVLGPLLPLLKRVRCKRRGASS